jgi:hypothetical protein
VSELAPQLSLLDLPSERMLREFAQHRRAHPEVYEELRRLALEARRRGRTRMGIAALFEVLRWERSGIGHDAGDFKLNQNLRALYARHLMETVPELRGFFETRRLRSV